MRRAALAVVLLLALPAAATAAPAPQSLGTFAQPVPDVVITRPPSRTGR